MGSDSDNCAVKIAVRERPVRNSLKGCTESSIVGYHPNSNILIVDERPFIFDYVLDPAVPQSQVFDDLIRPLVGYFVQGFNCTALAYGQTGTGKSYTMGLDSINFEGENIGVIPRCLKEIFSEGAQDIIADDGLSKVRKLSVSFIEIYNEKVYDLLAENATDPIVAKGYRYTGGSRKPLGNLQDCYAILMQGNKNRHVRPTKMNSQSSRSHAIFTIHMCCTSFKFNGEESIINSCMNIVDLAGSEGVRRTGHQGVAMSEGVNINQGLLSIGKVLQAMTVGSKVIPYRDSVLSSVLQDSLNPNSYLTLLACISPHREDLSETLSTLRFAQNAKQLKNTPQINNIIAAIKKNAKLKHTPYKIKPLQSSNAHKATPFKRTLAAQPGVSLKLAIKSNTFCTPKKQRLEVNKCNQTDIGSHQRQKISNVGMNLPNMGQLESTHNRESMFNRSLDLNASLSSLNISSSTAVDCATNNKANNNNFSPVIRKCLTELETGLEKKFLEILQRNLHTIIAPKTPALAPPVQNSLPSTMRSEIKSIMKEILAETLTASDSPLKVNAKCQLFSSSADIFKIPDVPANPGAPKTSSPKSVDDHHISFTKTFFYGATETDKNVFNKSIRRSRRISQRFALETPAEVNNSLISNGIENHTIRRSARRSVFKNQQAFCKKKCELACCYSPVHNQKIQPQEPKKVKVAKTANINNSIVENCYSGTSLIKHRKAILDLLNKGSRKEVQVLPMIGQKRAFQIVTHRTLNGKFKNLGQVEKLPLWRGREWTRFAEVTPGEPWCITPYRNVEDGTSNAHFNAVHSKTRCIVERTIGILKARWKIVSNGKRSRYSPEKMAMFANVSAALHNICIEFKVPQYITNETDPEPITYEIDIGEETPCTKIGEQIRNNIKTTLINNLL